MKDPETSAQPQVVELRITHVLGTGIVNVNGPIDNKMLCYSLMEMARDAIKDHVDRRQAEVELNKALAAPNKNGSRFRLFR